MVIIIFVLILINLCYTQWINITDPILPRADRAMAVGEYNNEIFLLGGEHFADQLVEYDIANNIFIDHGEKNLSNNLLNDTNGGGSFYTQINHILYMIHPFGDTFSIFNMETITFIPRWNNITIPIKVDEHGCLASATYPYGQFLFVIAGDDRNDFQILNITSFQWLYNASSLNEVRLDASCIFDPITDTLYTIGGWDRLNSSFPAGHIKTIEFIKINDMNNITQSSWKYMNGNLSNGLDASRCVLRSNFIFVIGGRSNDDDLPPYVFMDTVHIINTIDRTISVSPDRLSYGVVKTSAVIVDDIIYVFGGYNLYAGGYLNIWMKYNLPSLSPTFEPTLHPTVQPSIFPTLHPTLSPSFDPTFEPTLHPTVQPSFDPTTVPSFNPTINPSNDPIFNRTVNGTILLQYGVSMMIIFKYEVIDNNKSESNISLIIANILQNIIDEELVDECNIDDINGNYHVTLNINNTAMVNGTVFVCDETAQNILISFVNNGNELETDFITSIHNETNIIIVVDYFIQIHAEPIYKENELIATITSTEILVNSKINQTIVNKEIDAFDVGLNIDIIFIILASIGCIGVTIPLLDMIYIKRIDEYHIYNTLLYTLSVCNLWTDIIISYQLWMYYIRMNHNESILIIAIIANIFVMIPYVYNTILATIKIYVIRSHLCCLFSYLLINICGDSYIILQLLTSNLFNINTINSINKFEMRKAKTITIIIQNIPQIIVQSIFMIFMLQSIDGLLIISITLSVISLIPYLSFIIFYIQCKEMIVTEYVLDIKTDKISQSKNNASNKHLLTKKLSDILAIKSSEIQIIRIVGSKISIIHEIDINKYGIDTDKYIKHLYENKLNEMNNTIKNIYDLDCEIETELNLDIDINILNKRRTPILKHLEMAIIESNTLNINDLKGSDEKKNDEEPATPISPEDNDWASNNIYFKPINENKEMNPCYDDNQDEQEDNAENEDLFGDYENSQNTERRRTRNGDDVYTAIDNKEESEHIDILRATTEGNGVNHNIDNNNNGDNHAIDDDIDGGPNIVVTNPGENVENIAKVEKLTYTGGDV